MLPEQLNSVSQLVDKVEGLGATSQLLFRGQDCDAPLLPKIARDDPTRDTTELERNMIRELKRRTARHPTLLGVDDWDALVVAQHHGMATRLLDWTTNPLIALWFAVSGQEPAADAYVFLLPVSDENLLQRDVETDPFATKATRIFKPSVNNERLSAQAGWFTAHNYSTKAGKFYDLHGNDKMGHSIQRQVVPGIKKKDILKSLDRVGVNQESIFPGLEGNCKYIDWYFRCETSRRRGPDR
jgi:hypothetical protein